ncbi:hypothetical protein B0I29_13325 [Actinoplanes lutulentus]|uniref:Hsp70 protein n=2 Tax=Actinoplanes lutulentus TaxID=1287878 RepID=A0A327YX69_9ACTN|nr:hypothetical protein B0I29_13325 [Actinoplanes lutulentus]
MPANDLHLAVDCAAWQITAASETAGRFQPVLFDGHSGLPNGVYTDPGTGALITGAAGLAAGMADPERYQPDPLGMLYASAHDDGTPDPIAAVSAVLAHVANVACSQAGIPITTLTIVDPRTWGHRARHRLSQAATSAGLPAPNIVSTAAAATAFAGGAGPFVLVGTAAPDLTILDLSDGSQQLAKARICDTTAPAIDEALVQIAVPDGSIDRDWRMAREVQQVRAILAVQPRAPLLLPEPHPPAAITRTDASAAAQPHLAQVDDHIKQLLADGDIDIADITSVILVDDDPIISDLEIALGATSLPAPIRLRDPHAVSYGALRLVRPSSDQYGETAATVRLPRVRLTLASLARVAVLAACSVTLLFQTIATADPYTWGIDIIAVLWPEENLALAAALAVLTGWAAAQLAPTTWVMSSGADDQTTTGLLLRRGFFGAAVLGLVVSGLWGLGTGVAVGFIDDTFVTAALIGAAPIAACAALIALAAPRIPVQQIQGWLHRINPPVTFIAVGAAGVCLQRFAYGTVFYPDMIWLRGTAQFLGAILLGVATGCLATRQSGLRLFAAAILGLGYMLIANYTTVPYLTSAFLVLIAWWALGAAATTITGSTPRAATWFNRWSNPLSSTRGAPS